MSGPFFILEADVNGTIVWLIVLFGFISKTALSQSRYPADTVLRDNSVVWYKKAAILPVSAWQRISYNTILFDCPYFPSCSNYFVQSVQKAGLFKSVQATSSRLMRCHPLAHRSHKTIANRASRPVLEYYDGRLIDSVLVNPVKRAKNHEIALSAVIPGLGMVKQKRVSDGVFAFVLVVGSAYAFQSSLAQNQSIPAFAWGLATITFYSGNLYSTRNY